MKGVARIGVVAGVMVLCLTACGESRNSVSSEITSAISQPAEVSTEYFTPFWESQMVAQQVTSLPVPAVVGTPIQRQDGVP